jgi:tRNA A58 N-methylase Trm61
MAHIVGDTGQVVTVDIDEDLVAGAREHLSASETVVRQQWTRLVLDWR